MEEEILKNILKNGQVYSDELLKALEIYFDEEKQNCIDKIKEKGVAVHRLNVVVGYFMHLKDLDAI